MKRIRKTPVSEAGFFRKYLLQNRLKKNISQAELAQMLGWTSPQYISNIERSISAFPTDKLPRLAKILDVPLSRLIDIMSRDFKMALYERLKAKN